MSESAECQCIVDSSGLLEIANASGNLKNVLLLLLAEGIIGVPTCVWKEFRDAYPDEADELEEHVGYKIRMHPSFTLQASSVAEKLNSGFSRSPHDGQVRILVASISIVSGLIVITGKEELSFYKKTKCQCADAIDWVSARS